MITKSKKCLLKYNNNNFNNKLIFKFPCNIVLNKFYFSIYISTTKALGFGTTMFVGSSISQNLQISDSITFVILHTSIFRLYFTMLIFKYFGLHFQFNII